MTPKQRGGQPGNTNALKHGFYARDFDNTENADLSEIENDLTGEINMLKVCTRRLLTLSETESEKIDFEAQMQLLETLGKTATRIATLTRTQKLLTGEEPGITDALNQALGEVLKEMQIK